MLSHSIELGPSWRCPILAGVQPEDRVGGGASELVVDLLRAPWNGKREADYATNHQPENCECQEDMLLQPPTGNGL